MCFRGREKGGRRRRGKTARRPRTAFCFPFTVSFPLSLPLSLALSQALIQELDFAAYLGVPAFLIPIRQHDNPNLARVLLNHLLTGHHSTMFWIRVPIMSWEDTRDDMIENEPLKRTEDCSEEEERTWVW
uniref:PRMT5 TIM barrel domain-containing protein n=1 Tax=Callorhinchus milii TaxID=7868 RepID=A0A4W3GDL8_CALMI